MGPARPWTVSHDSVLNGAAKGRVHLTAYSATLAMMTEHLLHDVRFALRTIRRNLRFTAVVVLTLAVAIGMNTAIFSVFNAVVMRPLGYPHADRLVWLSTVGTEGESGLVTGPDFIDWRNQSLSFDRMAAYATGDLRLLSATGAARINSAAVTEDFWTMTGALPATRASAWARRARRRARVT